MQRENKWQDRLQNEFMDFWDSKKETLNLGEYSDAVTQFWLLKIDTAIAERDKEWLDLFTYEDNGKYFTGLYGDADVTKEVINLITKQL